MLPVVEARGLLCVADPHLAATPPGQRLEGYADQILAKVRDCLDHAAALELAPVFLGDMFHWPRENPNSLLVELIGLLAPVRPFVLVGNHDKHQARFTSDTSLAVLEAAGAVRLMAEPGPAFHLATPRGTVLVGGSPDAAPLPRSVEPDGAVATVWLTHHGICFGQAKGGIIEPREIPGLDWVINGHLHLPQTTMTRGRTRWANPGNIARLTFSPATQAREPAAAVWLPGAQDLERWVVPHLPFSRVFPDQPFAPEPGPEERRSLFLKGLERLAWRRTQEGLGLRQFLAANLNPELPETALVWQLYEEVAGARHDDP